MRVLRAFGNRQRPNEKDIKHLRSCCPDHLELDPVELASVVIRRFIESKRGESIRRQSVAEPPYGSLHTWWPWLRNRSARTSIWTRVPAALRFSYYTRAAFEHVTRGPASILSPRWGAQLHRLTIPTANWGYSPRYGLTIYKVLKHEVWDAFSYSSFPSVPHEPSTTQI